MSEHDEERKRIMGAWMTKAFGSAVEAGLSDRELLSSSISVACAVGFQMGIPAHELLVVFEEQYRMCAQLGMKPRR